MTVVAAEVKLAKNAQRHAEGATNIATIFWTTRASPSSDLFALIGPR